MRLSIGERLFNAEQDIDFYVIAFGWTRRPELKMFYKRKIERAKMKLNQLKQSREYRSLN